ncbi:MULTISPECIES: DUF1108 family protein [Staphylococcus]|uniref:Uncharacterized protein n=2 Tax=Staphylococcus TaxID=1279 RepID=A0A1L7RSP3_STAXY|nr:MULTISPECIES: DUF1108 family protein [Staphylococcus]MDW8564293.1 DUF1108 family protein [Staphylococcus shinii]MDW8567519.1 DUF1108 family protein [Staphylococcus shinii]MEC5301089.1 DUF1108 family protein [Staphylococcus shinii]PTI10390.1 hypothetical protein BU096_01675 [Staphylococcus xylosus]RIN03236.1 DUF1108 family protein [Staphylococcus shinii]
MYYETGTSKSKKIQLLGFDFKINLYKHDDNIEVTLLNENNDFIDGIHIYDEYAGMATAQEILEYSAYIWIEQNTDEADRIMNRVMQW